MLIRFTATNFRSLRDEQELSLVASTLQDRNNSIRTTPHVQPGVLTAAAIYGANASGKSNVLKALQFVVTAVVNSQRAWRPGRPIPVQPFRLDDESSKRESRFSVDFEVDGIRHHYGFSLDTARIGEEWLYAFPAGRKQVWFERHSEGDSRGFKFGKHLTGENRSISALTRADSLFLSAAAQNNHSQLTPIYEWFNTQLQFVSSHRAPAGITALLAHQDPSVLRGLAECVTAADLGVSGVEIDEKPLDEQQKTFFSGIYKLAKETDLLGDYSSDNSAMEVPESEFRLRLRHRSDVAVDGVLFEIEDESAGTIAWLSLVGVALKTLTKGGVLCVDEIDTSLHPLLAKRLVKMFTEKQSNPRRAQLIFNTHETNLLSGAELRRDQVWFVEKDRAGASHLYPLTEFKPRPTESLERGYLQGRYGAIPFIGEPGLVKSIGGNEDGQVE